MTYYQLPTPTGPPPRAPQVFIVNVGTNLAHDLYSVVYEDGAFEFVPIPLLFDGARFRGVECHSSGMAEPATYSRLRTADGQRPLLSLFPDRLQHKYADVVAHNDPLLRNAGQAGGPCFSYGDVPRRNVRASSLRHAASGDSLLFLANLRRAPASQPAGGTPERALYFIGILQIAEILQYEPGQTALGRPHTRSWAPFATYVHNAHVNQLLTLPDGQGNEPFTVFEGSAGSQRFERAVPITEELCRVCLRDRQGAALDYARYRSINACVGVYTRTVRPHFDLALAEDRERYARLMTHIALNNDVTQAGSISY